MIEIMKQRFNLLKTQLIIIWLLLRLKHFENTRLSISGYAIFKIKPSQFLHNINEMMLTLNVLYTFDIVFLVIFFATDKSVVFLKI